LRWSLHHHIDTPTYYNRNICLIGDVAHASTPHQGAGAGQCLEDAVVLSHLLSLVSRPSELEIAFAVFDSICRPRAQKIVDTSYEAGSMYFLSDPVCGENIAEIVANTRERFHWIWEHDLEEDLRRATDGFQKRSKI
jgi:salicylate hydroxylase